MHYFLRLHTLSQLFDEQIQRWGGSLVSLGLRLFIGWQFFKAGLIKVSDWTVTLSLFNDEYTVPVLPPEVAAVMGAGGELFFPVLLALGLFSRPAALGLLAVNVMAVISYPQLFQFECPAAINDHFYWGISLLVLVAFGPGKFSLDEFFKAKRT
ncbi:DoxX family protein [Undibacterium sp. Dicai25W]|uniref:DoxX family protein n=1 Tax=Undibacterium sp. Dicai25W TaxID=3413034 RepID=UPI003BEFE601